MSKSKVYRLRPKQPFSASYPLTVADSFMVQNDSIYLYIFSIDQPLSNADCVHLTNLLTQSLSTFFEHAERSPTNLPELLGEIYDDPATGRLTAKVTPSSTVPFIVSDRSSDVRLTDLKPHASFPLQPLKPSIFGPGLTAPPPDATKGVQALWVQLTFIDGGFVIHLHIHHWVAGAASAGRLVEAWFERARALARTTATLNDQRPSRMEKDTLKHAIDFGNRDELTECLKSTTVPQLDHPYLMHVPGSRRVWAGLALHPLLLKVSLTIFKFILSYLPFLLPRSDVQIFYFKPDALRRLQVDLRDASEDDSIQLTANDCLTALLWSCITRARTSFTSNSDHALNTAAESTILAAVDYKSRLSPPLNPYLFGNTSLDRYTTVPISNLVSRQPTSSPANYSPLSPISVTAQKLHGTISATDDHMVRSFYQLINSRRRILDTRARPFKFQYGNDLLSTSWEHVHKDPGLLQLDVLSRAESGKKTRIVFEKMRYMHANGVDGAVVVFPAYGRKWDQHVDSEARGVARQNGLEVAISLKKTSLQRLMEDELFLRYADWGADGGYAAES